MVSQRKMGGTNVANYTFNELKLNIKSPSPIKNPSLNNTSNFFFSKNKTKKTSVKKANINAINPQVKNTLV